jgi:predicted enzyme related to lactoylglutathione lyase
MLRDSSAFSGFAVNDMDRAKAFYTDVLGLDVTEEQGRLTLHLAGDRPTIVYPKSDHVPATFTILNFPVDDIDTAVNELTARGVEFARYDGLPQDDKGVLRGRMHGRGPDIAWFTDPAGNIFSVLQEG